MPARPRVTVTLREPLSTKSRNGNFVEIAAVTQGDKEFRFRRPLKVVRSFEEGHILFESKRLQILGWGKSDRAALNAFGRDFVVLWSLIAEEANAVLHPSAQKLKRQLKRAVSVHESEDAQDRRAIKERRNEPSVPWEQVKRELGL